MHEISIAEAEIPTAEGIPAIDGRNRAVDYARADVEGIDFEAIAKRTRFEKRDGNRVGLLAAGTWNAQESPSIGTVAASRRHSRVMVSKAPRSRKNHVSGTTTASMSWRSSSGSVCRRS